MDSLRNTHQNPSRRRFNRAFGLTAAGVVMAPELLSFDKFKMPVLKKPQIGLQLWTVRDLIAKDLAGTLNRIAEMGYAGVETAFWPEHISLEKGAKAIKTAGLPVFSIHAELPIGEYQDVVRKMVDLYECNRIIWHGWPEDVRYKTKKGTQQLAEIYDRANEFAVANDLVFGVHNHWWEFELWPDGSYPFEYLLHSLDDSIIFEIDTYWVKVAGQDPAEVLARFGSRAPLLHIKDGPGRFTESLDDNEPEPMVAVGQGVQDFPGIMNVANNFTEWMIVELDNCDCDMIEAVKSSFDYLVNNELGVGKQG